MKRSTLFTLALAALLPASHSALALYNQVPLGQITPQSLQYGGSLYHVHGWAGHTVLAPTLQQCEEMLNQLQASHPTNGWGCATQSYTREGCSKRGMFRLMSPADPQGDTVTTTITVPARHVRDVGDLRKRFGAEEYEAELQRLGGGNDGARD